jgi:signal transduction histidine kinase
VRGRRLALVIAAAALGLAIGIAAEQSATRFAHPAGWIPDLAVGWTFLACGLTASYLRPASRSGLLMAVTGFAWFLPNFGLASVTALAWIADRTLYLYRGPLVHLLLTFPAGRAGTRLTRVAVGGGYVAAIATPVWQSDPATVVLSVLLVACSAVEHRGSRGRGRRARLVALRATALFAVVVAGGAVARMVVAGKQAIEPSHVVFELTLCALAVGLLLALLVAPWERAAVTDLVVELGEGRSDGLRDELASALGDPSLEVGYWVPGNGHAGAPAGSFVDARGRPFELPQADSGRSVTTVRGGDQPVAVLVHDPAVMEDPGLLESVSAAAQLAASNARLQAEVRARVAELAASRLRLLEAGDEERRRLERRLHEGAERRLKELAVKIERSRLAASSPEAGGQLAAAEGHLRETLEDLSRLGRGLHPRELSELGLEGALRALAARAPVPVSVRFDVDGGEIPPAIEAAAYFVCAEALANVAKYAAAARADVSVSAAEGRLLVEVRDDGTGGADIAGGSGLSGLRDRVETLGGSLTMTSPAGAGTRLSAEIPLHSAAEP